MGSPTSLVQVKPFQLNSYFFKRSVYSSPLLEQHRISELALEKLKQILFGSIFRKNYNKINSDKEESDARQVLLQEDPEIEVKCTTKTTKDDLLKTIRPHHSSIHIPSEARES